MIAVSDLISKLYANIRNYNLYSSNHASSRLYGGVALYFTNEKQSYTLLFLPHFMELSSILHCL